MVYLPYIYLHLVDFMVNVGKDTIHGSYGYFSDGLVKNYQAESSRVDKNLALNSLIPSVTTSP